ncbi:rhomboid family intramembrane serine protease [Clostridium sp.]|uniref:rhomboid family intramembrane serine protease n=1 Tax=Clostridium sp. TaxID=1506 RepID=UPI001DD83F69|nr:rhomboid family intramembrane serine protease [Clostridium sp.]MBS5937319.1 rhomboid family intramembrane serine protease [Clostridium sp.]
MKKFEKVFFNILTKELKFYMKNYYSNFHGEDKWVGLLNLEDTYVAVAVTLDKDEEITYKEVKDYLEGSLDRPFIINLIVLNEGDYFGDYHNSSGYYNKLVFSLSERKAIYCSEGSKVFLQVLEYMNKLDTKKKINFKEYKITYILIIINILVFLIEAFLSRNIFDIDFYTLVYMGAKVNILIDHGEVYRLLTAAFLHGGLMHILFNMGALNIIGKEVETIYGAKKYLAIYFLSALGGNIFSYIMSPDSISVGASGAVFGLLGAMLIFGIKERKRIGKRYAKNIIETIAINVVIGLTMPNIDNFGHLGGLVFGGILAFILSIKKQK